MGVRQQIPDGREGKEEAAVGTTMMDVLAARVAGDAATWPSLSSACQPIRHFPMPNGPRYPRR